LLRFVIPTKQRFSGLFVSGRDICPVATNIVMFGRRKEDEGSTLSQGAGQRSFWITIVPVIACGAGLFSDGYINNVCAPSPAGPTLEVGLLA